MIKVTGTSLLVSEQERDIGFEGDSMVNFREFEISDPDLFDYDFKLDLRVKDHSDVAELEKRMEEGKLILKWVITARTTQKCGLLFAQLRAVKETGETWHSEKACFWLGEGLDADYAKDPVPSEFHQMEQQISQARSEVVSINNNLADKITIIEDQAQRMAAAVHIIDEKALIIDQKAQNAEEKINYVTEKADIVLQTEPIVTQYAQQASLNAANASTSAQSALQSAAEATSSAQAAGISANIADAASHSAKGYFEGMQSSLSQFYNSTAKKYGVRRVKGSSSHTLERIWDAEGMNANAGIDSETVQNDFDNIYPWSDMRICNIRISGGKTSVTAYEGEPTFTRDGSNGQVAVEIPRFYICPPDLDHIHEYWGVSKFPITGWYLCPDFIGENGKILDKVYYSAYHAAESEGKLVSAAGKFPETGRARSAFRSLARNTDECCSLVGLSYHNILSTLFTVEFATLNSQAVMRGVSLLSHNSAADQAQVTEVSTNRIILPTAIANKYVVGQTIVIGTAANGNNVASNRLVTAIMPYDSNNSALHFDSYPINIAAGCYISSRAWKTGSADQVAASSGSATSNTNGKYPCTYRGIENPWGNLWQWIDGVNIYNYQAWICENPKNFEDNKFEAPYKQTSYLNSSVSGFIKTMGYDQQFPWARLPVETGGTSGTYYCDNYYTAPEKMALTFGGYFINSQDLGIWYLSANVPSSYGVASTGARLMWKQEVI